MEITVGVTFDAYIDSGAPGELTLPESSIEKLSCLEEPVVDGQAKIGTLAFDNPEVHFIPMLNSTGYANIGSSNLREHVITFDHKNGLIAFR